MELPLSNAFSSYKQKLERVLLRAMSSSLLELNYVDHDERQRHRLIEQVSKSLN